MLRMSSKPRVSITKSRRGHYTVALSVGRTVVAKEPYLDNLHKARAVAAEMLALWKSKPEGPRPNARGAKLQRTSRRR